MSWRDALHKLIWGTPFRPEYLCTPFEPHTSALHIVDQNGTDVTHEHVFLGYQPLLLGFWSKSDSAQSLSLHWQNEQLEELAKVEMKQVEHIPWEDQTLHLYQGTRGNQYFLSRSQRWRHNFRQRLKPRKNNVYLDPALYDQVKAAYAIPRKISVASVWDGEKGNVFPTDLNGPIQPGFYAISLREAGKAHKQVLTTKRILLAEMDIAQAVQVYGLGKNHVKDLRPLDELTEATNRIEGFPVLNGVTKYRVLERITGKTLSIHHIHIFRVMEEKVIDPDAKVLAHIHRDYATWRLRNGLPTEYTDR